MKVLLTGGTGFIGRHMLERLLRDGYEVRLVALPGTTEELPRHTQMQTVIGSLADSSLLFRAARSVDVVVHLAAKVTGLVAREFRAVNIDGTRNLINASVEAGVRRFIYMSSTAVYGLAPFPMMWPLAEDSPQAAHGSRVLRLYGWSKIEAEKIVRRTRAERGLEYVILRPPVVYGFGAATAHQLLAALFRFPNTVGLDVAPSGVLQWLHVDDLVEMVTRVITTDEGVDEAFNAAGPPTTVREVAAVLNTILLLRWRPPVRPIAAGGRRGLPFSMEKAHRLLNFVPTVSIDEGLRDMFRYSNGAAGNGTAGW